MIQEETNLNQRAAALRQAFDCSFAAAPEVARAATEAFLAIGAGNDLYALRLAEIAGLFADKKIAPLPSESTDLLGLTSFRGALIPVYDLRTLLGYSAAATSVPRWLVLVAAKTPVGVAFDSFEGYLDLPPEALAQESHPNTARPYVKEIAHVNDSVRAVIHLPLILEAITHRTFRSPN